MNLLTISIVMSCNNRCYYCPVKKNLMPIDYKVTIPREGTNFYDYNCIKNDYLLKWLDKYIDPNEFIIEITGGEPGLYIEIDTLIPELNKRNYRGLIKTNGSLPIPKSNNFQLISTWHEQAFPKYYDQILILKNPKEDWQNKVEHCKKNNLIYHLQSFDNYYLTGKYQSCNFISYTKFKYFTHINSCGLIVSCPKQPTDGSKSIFNMTEPVLLDFSKFCPKCRVAFDVERFLTIEGFKDNAKSTNNESIYYSMSDVPDWFTKLSKSEKCDVIENLYKELKDEAPMSKEQIVNELIT